MATLINATPHAITFVNDDGEIVHQLPKPDVDFRRLESYERQATLQLGPDVAVDLVSVEHGLIDPPLPDPVEGVYFVVSILVAQGAPHRRDLLFPGQVKRNETGAIIGCLSLGRLP